MHYAYFSRSDDFASSRDKFVILRLEIQKQLSIIVNMLQGSGVQILYVVSFIIGMSNHESHACKIRLGVGVISVN